MTSLSYPKASKTTREVLGNSLLSRWLSLRVCPLVFLFKFWFLFKKVQIVIATTFLLFFFFLVEIRGVGDGEEGSHQWRKGASYHRSYRFRKLYYCLLGRTPYLDRSPERLAYGNPRSKRRRLIKLSELHSKEELSAGDRNVENSGRW